MIKKILKLINNADVLNEFVSSMLEENKKIKYKEKHAEPSFNFNLKGIELISISRYGTDYTTIHYYDREYRKTNWDSKCSIEQHAKLVNKFNEMTDNSK